jgi:hypothetical protein
MSFKANFGDEVCEEFVEDTFSRLEGLRGVSVGEEEVLDWQLLESDGAIDCRDTCVLGLRMTAGRDSCQLLLLVPLMQIWVSRN